MRKKKWRVVEGFDTKGELLGYYVVFGLGQDPRELLFSTHGCYLLKSAAREDMEEYNREMADNRSRYIQYRVIRREAALVKVKGVR